MQAPHPNSLNPWHLCPWVQALSSVSKVGWRTCSALVQHVSMLSHFGLCNPIEHSPPGSSAHRILQARYWSRLPFPSPGDLPDPGTETVSLASPALASGFFTFGATYKAHRSICTCTHNHHCHVLSYIWCYLSKAESLSTQHPLLQA